MDHLNSLIAKAQEMAMSGMLDKAIDTYTEMLRICAKQRIPPINGYDVALPILIDATISKKYNSLIPIEACSLLAEDLANRYGNFIAAETVLKKKIVMQREWCNRYFGNDILYLGEDWVRNIGHIGLLNYVLKLQKMGKLPWKKVCIVSRKNRVANLPFLQHFSPYFELAIGDAEFRDLSAYSIAAGLRVFDLIDWPEMEGLHFQEACNLIEGQWQARCSKQPLALTAECQSAGAAFFNNLGFAQDVRFICVHVREGGFHKDENTQQRTASIDRYQGVVTEALKRGFLVVRLGDKSMRKMQPMPNLIDYAVSEFKSPQLDVFFAARCSFYVGTTSGLMYLPHAFGSKILITNYSFLFGGPALGKYSLFIPKIITCERQKLKFEAMMSKKWMRSTYREDNFEDIGGSYEENSEEEIREAAVELFDNHSISFEQTSFSALIPEKFRSGTSLVGTSFAKKYRYLL